jgi:hypothetical protein
MRWTEAGDYVIDYRVFSEALGNRAELKKLVVL